MAHTLQNLIVRRDGATRARYPLEPAVYLLGRDPALRLCLNDAQVSRQHAALVVDREGACIRDLGSRNGSFVNGARLPDRCPQRLSHGDLIQLGDTELRYERRERRGRVGTPRAAASAPAAPRHAARAHLVPVLAVTLSALLGIALAWFG